MPVNRAPQGIGTGVFGVMSKKVPGGRFGWERESGTGEGGGTGVAFVGRDKSKLAGPQSRCH